jgi:hypothetical protein
MSFYHGKLKVLTAVGGIALALLPSLQQTHAVCQLAGCMDRIVAEPAEAGGSQDVGCNQCCNGTPTSPCERPQQQRDGDAPCGPYCWCAQAPNPSDAPKNSTECAKSTVSILHAIVPLTAANDGLFATGGRTSFCSESLPSSSAGDTCRLLCRYLI